ncbi:MAG: hypothetical protein A2Y57_03345 [Candidatus Woykebacteria bacterium RBG_13_40_7b]|uniref:Uncharacterized protein n=1 Tax=Candidatus Woykebacteria bacterium RBG_13_40_7b TaxID=1802594 RepID=A0A1G1W9M8_9BACT|nr:MAG: hypothetical protein A2Y57_03345 [Candidatus Woykebacteria bacterium RBG_13_40_7b]
MKKALIKLTVPVLPFIVLGIMLAVFVAPKGTKTTTGHFLIPKGAVVSANYESSAPIPLEQFVREVPGNQTRVTVVKNSRHELSAMYQGWTADKKVLTAEVPIVKADYNQTIDIRNLDSVENGTISVEINDNYHVLVFTYFLTLIVAVVLGGFFLFYVKFVWPM